MIGGVLQSQCPSAPLVRFRQRPECAVWRLSALARPLLRVYFAALSADDLYLRFGDHRSPELLERYIAGIDFWQSTVLGVFNERLELVGLAHLSPQVDGYELGLSVLAGSRALGIGALLLRRALQCARLSGARRVHMHCAAENRGIIRLGRRVGVQFEVCGGDADGVIELAPLTPLHVCSDLLEAHGAILLLGLRTWSQLVRSALVKANAA